MSAERVSGLLASSREGQGVLVCLSRLVRRSSCRSILRQQEQEAEEVVTPLLRLVEEVEGLA